MHRFFVKRIVMRKPVQYLSIAAFALTLLVALSSCGNRSRKDFNRLLVELADDDAVIDREDWQKIARFLEENKRRFAEFYENDSLQTSLVKADITKYFAHRRPAKDITFIGVGESEHLGVNFYLERSGSMTPYDAASGDGRFKAAIVSLLNNLPEGTDAKMYVVNSSINPYPQGVKQFLNDNNIFLSTKGLGDASYTDFGAIFSELLTNTREGEISILVTDMIYSTRQMIGVNPQKVFSEAQGMTHAVFKDEVRNQSMLIMKLMSSYDGPYYSYDAPSSGKTYHGERPYYIVFVGSNSSIARLTIDKQYAPLMRLADLRGFEHMYLFSTDGVYHPYYSLLLRSDDIRGRFRPEHGQNDRITNVKDVEPDAASGDIKLALAVDLSKMLIDEDYLTDIENYLIEADNEITIEQIRKIDSKDVTPASRKFTDKATHVFVLKTKALKNNQEVKLRLLNRLPQWIKTSSSDDDRDLHSATFAETTFGLQYLLQGIYDSYQKHAKDVPCYFTLDLNLKK